MMATAMEDKLGWFLQYCPGHFGAADGHVWQARLATPTVPGPSGSVDQVRQHPGGPLRFLKWRYHDSWMVYFMENPIKMDDLGGTNILGNLHVVDNRFTEFTGDHIWSPFQPSEASLERGLRFWINNITDSCMPEAGIKFDVWSRILGGEVVPMSILWQFGFGKWW